MEQFHPYLLVVVATPGRLLLCLAVVAVAALHALELGLGGAVVVLLLGQQQVVLGQVEVHL